MRAVVRFWYVIALQAWQQVLVPKAQPTPVGSDFALKIEWTDIGGGGRELSNDNRVAFLDKAKKCRKIWRKRPTWSRRAISDLLIVNSKIDCD